MPRTTLALSSFVSGEFSAKLDGRTDFDKYNSGVKTMENFLVHPQGAATRRVGTQHIAEVKDSSKTKVPEYGDKVTFYHNIKDLNGTTILSKNEVGLQNCVIDKTNQELISGIRDGLKLMKEGETITFLFPSYKAYGYYGIENKLGTNIPIQCTVTLNSINKTNENY